MSALPERQSPIPDVTKSGGQIVRVEVRPDQHGTVTGYTYGCRCDECRVAKREYQKTETKAGPELVERVFAALEREADFDGLCTASHQRLAELAGCSLAVAQWVVHHLADEGRVKIVGRTGRGGSLEVLIGGVA